MLNLPGNYASCQIHHNIYYVQSEERSNGYSPVALKVPDTMLIKFYNFMYHNKKCIDFG